MNTAVFDNVKIAVIYHLDLFKVVFFYFLIKKYMNTDCF